MKTNTNFYEIVFSLYAHQTSNNGRRSKDGYVKQKSNQDLTTIKFISYIILTFFFKNMLCSMWKKIFNGLVLL